MSDVGVPKAARSRPSWLGRVVALTVALLAVLVLTALYLRIGWWRMESACYAGARGAIHDSVSYDWSWRPLGFRCTYGNGETKTSLWF